MQKKRQTSEEICRNINIEKTARQSCSFLLQRDKRMPQLYLPSSFLCRPFLHIPKKTSKDKFLLHNTKGSFMRINRPLFLDMSFLANEPWGNIEFIEEGEKTTEETTLYNQNQQHEEE